jgi:hypothetical protein
LFFNFWSAIRVSLCDAAGSLHHLIIIALSAGLALSLPVGAQQFLSFWSQVEHNKYALVSVEVGLAILFILGLNYIHRSIRDHALAAVATGAGLVSFYPRRTQTAQRRLSRLKEDQGKGRTIMVMGSSGYGTVVDQVGSLSSVLEQCLGAQILLVNPCGHEASTRIRALGQAEHTLSTFRNEVRQSIALLKRLKAMGKTVTLKLYSDPPLVKMVILGDYLWLQHYHADLEVDTMPEYVLRHNRRDHGLYTLYTHYFIQRWQSAEIPEYDLETDELVYRKAGAEIRRERFEMTDGEMALPELGDVEPAAIEQGAARQLYPGGSSRSSPSSTFASCASSSCISVTMPSRTWRRC